MSEKIPLKEVLSAVDQNVVELWNAIDEEQKKTLKKEFFILNRYISNVKGQNETIQEHFVLAVNEYFNKHWNILQQHPELLWRLLCMCHYENKKVFFHEWIGLKRSSNPNNKKVKFLQDLYPNKKMDELELLSKMMTDKDMIELAKDHGWTDAQIKQL